MFYCKFQLTYDCDDDSKLSADASIVNSRREWRYLVAEFSTELSDENLGGKVTMLAYRAKPNLFLMIAAVDDIQPYTPAKAVKRIEKYLAAFRGDNCRAVFKNLRSSQPRRLYSRILPRCRRYGYKLLE